MFINKTESLQVIPEKSCNFQFRDTCWVKDDQMKIQEHNSHSFPLLKV
jgi:hypothetical protein